MQAASSLVGNCRHVAPGLWRYGLALAGLLLVALLHLNLSLGRWTLSVPQSDSFAALQFHLTSLPRLAMALLVGAALGLSGSLLQQLTQNHLVSPMTLGAASGA